MKHRNGFVTNSSSSSFVIAIKDGTTKKDVKEFIHKFEKNIDDALSWADSYSLDSVIDDIVDGIFSEIKWGSLELEGWKIISKEYSSEDGEYSDCAMYDMAYLLNSDFMKVK